MIGRRESKPFLPRFLTEKAIRIALQNLYVSLVGSNENVRILLEKDPCDIDRYLAKGNERVRECFIAAASWLALGSKFALADDIFAEQILEPARCAARFMMDIRRFSSPTTTLDGIIFARSNPHYSKAFREDRITLSVILPEIESVMSLRCSAKEYGEINYGDHIISGVQPIPYVNRMHYAVLSLKKKDRATATALSHLDFLKVSLHDIEKLTYSLAFENFCEIESDQLRLTRKHLGAACILCGRLLAVNIPIITIQSIFEPYITMSLFTRQKLLSPADMYKIKSFQGKYVRILSVLWNTLGFNEIQYPELSSIELADDPSDLLADDIAGFVRLRRKVTREILASHYAQIEKVPLIPRLEFENGWIRWLPCDKTHHQIKDSFITQHELIMERRARIALNSSVSPVLTPERIFDKQKLRTDGLARMICRDDKLKDCFLEIVKKNDDSGSLPHSWLELASSIRVLDPLESLSKLQWLRTLGLLRKTDEGIRITSRGFEVAYLAIADKLEIILKNELTRGAPHLISVNDLEDRYYIAPSLLIEGLKELENTDYVKCSDLNGRRCKLFWFVSRQPKDSKDPPEYPVREFQKQIDTLLHSILLVLGSVPYPLATSKVLELVQRIRKVNDIAVRVLLAELEVRGKIRRDGSSWSYPWEIRISDLFSSNPHSIFTVEQIMKRVHFPPVNAERLGRILQEMYKEGRIVELIPKYWTTPIDAADKMKKLSKLKLKMFIHQQVSMNKGSLDESRLLGMSLYYLYRIPLQKFSLHPQHLYRETIDEMLQKGEISNMKGFITKITKNT